MKNKFILLCSLTILIFIIAGCNKVKDPLPEDRFDEYAKLWNEQNFDTMYDYLSTETKDHVSKQDFVERYTKIYSDLEINNLKVSFTKPEEETDVKEKNEVQFPFSVSMESLAGEISFDHEATLVKAEEDEDKTSNWFLHWDTTFIFPDLEEGEEIAISTIQPKRGNISDRNGIPLAEEAIVREIGLVPEKMEGSKEDIIKRVSDLLGISEEKIEKELNASWVKPSYFVPLKKIFTNEMELREKLGEIPGIQGRDTLARVYFGEAAGHLTGNIAPITAEDLEKNPDKGYGNNDLIGRRGLERVLEDRLRGKAGIKAFIKKADETEVVLAEKEVQDGEDIQLTIDAILQSIIYEELEGKAGTAAVIHPLTGETLALVSSPSFDPNAFSLGATNEQLAAWENDPHNPFLIRFNSTFAPGSVLKALTAAIGLNEGAIDWNKPMDDVKGLTWAKDNWGDYRVKRVKDHGVPVDLEKALIYSDNIYFARAALSLGKDKFTQGLKNFGFEEEIPFLYPTIESTFGTIDSEAALADSSYGQAQIEMSVIHLAATYTPFLNGGNIIKPILEFSEEHGQIWKENVLKKEEAERINAALVKVIEDTNGTAKGAKIKEYSYPLAGKTGTAEYAKEKQGEKGRENGWFVAYNTEDPEILIALMIEDASSGLAVEKVKNIIVEYHSETGSFRNP